MLDRRSPILVHAWCLLAWMTAYAANSSIISDVAATVSAVLLFRWLWKQLGISSEMVRFVRMASILLAIILNLGWVISSGLHRFVLDRKIESSLIHLMKGGLDVSDYARALIFTTLFCLVLSVFGSFKRIHNLELQLNIQINNLNAISIARLSRTLLVLSSISLVLIFSGILGFRSVHVDGSAEGENPIWLDLYKSLLPGQILLSSLLLTKITQGRNGRSFLSISTIVISILTLIFVFFTEGRRPLLFVIIGLVYWYIFFIKRKPKFYLIPLYLIIIYPILNQGLLFFSFLRSDNALFNWETESVIDVVPEAWTRFQSSDKLVEAEKDNTTENLATRPLEATPLALAIQMNGQQKTFTLGENFLNSVVWAIPKQFSPEKKAYPVQEELLYSHFPIGRDFEEDTADSLYLSAYTEFSWCGLLVYPLLIITFWYLVLKWAISLKMNGLILSVVTMICFELFFSSIGESAVAQWLSEFRSILFWVCSFGILTLLKLKKDRVKM